MSVIVTRMEMPKVCIDGDYYGNCPEDESEGTTIKMWNRRAGEDGE